MSLRITGPVLAASVVWFASTALLAAAPVFVFHESPGPLVGRSPIFEGASEYWREDFESPEIEDPQVGLLTPGASLHGHWLCWASCQTSGADAVQYFGLDDPQNFHRVQLEDGGHGAAPNSGSMLLFIPGAYLTGIVLAVDADALGGLPNAVSMRLVERGFKSPRAGYTITALDDRGEVLGQTVANYPLDGFQPRSLSVYSPEGNVAFLQITYYGYDEDGGFVVDDVEYALDAPEVRLGDANLDGQVDVADWNLLRDRFGGRGDWSQGDFNGDGLVELSDFALLKRGGNLTAVPEPGSLALFASAGAAAIVLGRLVRRGVFA